MSAYKHPKNTKQANSSNKGQWHNYSTSSLAGLCFQHFSLYSADSPSLNNKHFYWPPACREQCVLLQELRVWSSNPALGTYKLYDFGSVTYLLCALLSLSGLCSILSDSPSSIISLPHLSEARYHLPLLWDFSVHVPVTHRWPLPTYSVQSESYWVHISQRIGSLWLGLSFYPIS